MASAALPPGSFYGRAAELGIVKRMIEQRVGAQIGFRGIGGIGKSALLAQIAAEAQKLAVTPYVVSIALNDEMTPLGFYRALLAGLRATGRTARRRALFFREDTLRHCEDLLRRLEQQEISLAKQVQNTFIATGGGKIGNPTTVVEDRGGVERTVLLGDLRAAFERLVAQELPEVVTVPPVATNYLPGRLLILLVDNLEQAQPEVLKVLRTLRSGALTERLILICAGRAEARPGNDDHTAPSLLTRELERLDEPTCHAWLTRSEVRDRALHEVIIRLCQGVPLLLRLCLHEVEQARLQGVNLNPADFTLPPPEPGGEAGLRVVEEFLVERFIERLERGDEEGKGLSRLVRFGCVLRDFADRDAIRALRIDGLPDDLDPLVRHLGERGLLSGVGLHPVVRQAALARLVRREPRRYREYCERAAAYHASAGRPDEALALRLQAGETIAGEELAREVAAAARAGNPTLAWRLVEVAAGATQQPDLAWAAALARIDLALAADDRDSAEAAAASAVALAREQPEREAALAERMRRLAPLRDALLQGWWLPRQPDSPEVLEQLLALALAFGESYRHAEAAGLYQLALAMAKRLDNRRGAAHALRGLGEALLMQEKPQQAQNYYAQALAEYRASADRLGAANALLGLGDALRLQAKPQEAQNYYEQALAEYRAIGNRQGTANVFFGLGEALRLQAKPQEAQNYYEQALAKYQAIADRYGAAKALRGLGETLFEQGDRPRAKEQLTQALDIGRQIQYRAMQFNALRTLIAIAEAEGDREALAAYRLEYQRLLVEQR